MIEEMNHSSKFHNEFIQRNLPNFFNVAFVRLVSNFFLSSKWSRIVSLLLLSLFSPSSLCIEIDPTELSIISDFARVIETFGNIDVDWIRPNSDEYLRLPFITLI